MCPSDSEFIVVSAADPDPVNFWIQSLELYDCDLQSLQPNQDLTESVINAAQNVLKRHFNLGGCESTALAHSLKFQAAPTDKLCIQILHTGMYMYILCSLGSFIDNGVQS